MTFKNIGNSLPAIGLDLNDAFYRVGKGDIFPISGSDLDYTNNYGNLGSDTYRWKLLYANSVMSCTSQTFENQYTSVILTTSASEIELIGLYDPTYISIIGVVNTNVYSKDMTVSLRINDNSANYKTYRYGTYTPVGLTSTSEVNILNMSTGGSISTEYHGFSCGFRIDIYNKNNSLVDLSYTAVGIKYTSMGKGYGTNHVQNGYAVYDDGSKESITSLQLIIGGTTTAVFMAQSKIIYSVIKR